MVFFKCTTQIKCFIAIKKINLRASHEGQVVPLIPKQQLWERRDREDRLFINQSYGGKQ